mmetsp:Transcript_48564/g.128763  ORF Transcript_48564/g.128763 Transcript_48564/m.128763 type:complete len:276 (+) Transcript_48564:1674-2501(+)
MPGRMKLSNGAHVRRLLSAPASAIIVVTSLYMSTTAGWPKLPGVTETRWEHLLVWSFLPLTRRIQCGSSKAMATSLLNTSCQQRRATQKMSVGSMFWPWMKLKPFSTAQFSTCCTACLLPQPWFPSMTMTPPDCSNRESRTFVTCSVAGQSSQLRRVLFETIGTWRIVPLKRYTLTGMDFPFIATSPRFVNSRTLLQASNVVESTSTSPFLPWPINRAAVLTVSPRTVYSRRWWLPTTPHQTSPVATPTRPSISSSSKVSMSLWAVSTARMGSSL